MSSTNFKRSAPWSPSVAGLVYCSDWSAIALDAAGADAKGVAACHRRYVRAVRALADMYRPGSAARIQTAAQSEVILARPSDYWIDVIDAGRHFRLADVQTAAGQGDDEGERVGAVIAALMRCADLAAADATIVLDDGDDGALPRGNQTARCLQDAVLLVRSVARACS